LIPFGSCVMYLSIGLGDPPRCIVAHSPNSRCSQEKIIFLKKNKRKCYIGVILSLMDYGKAIKKIRNDLLLTQDEMAKELGVSYATINRWENNRNVPTIKAKRKIRDYCKLRGVELKDA
jgi:putative transcriptional regulator